MPGPYFYPRSPCGERRPTMQRALGVFSISIHALLAESDVTCASQTIKSDTFLSTLSLRRATGHVNATDFHSFRISIHALLAESDAVVVVIVPAENIFLSTLSLRRATWYGTASMFILSFLSTLSLRRATVGGLCKGHHRQNFYPRSPCGERLTKTR